MFPSRSGGNVHVYSLGRGASRVLQRGGLLKTLGVGGGFRRCPIRSRGGGSAPRGPDLFPNCLCGASPFIGRVPRPAGRPADYHPSIWCAYTVCDQCKAPEHMAVYCPHGWGEFRHMLGSSVDDISFRVFVYLDVWSRGVLCGLRTFYSPGGEAFLRGGTRLDCEFLCLRGHLDARAWEPAEARWCHVRRVAGTCLRRKRFGLERRLAIREVVSPLP